MAARKNRQDATLTNNTARKKEIAALKTRLLRLEREVAGNRDVVRKLRKLFDIRR